MPMALPYLPPRLLILGLWPLSESKYLALAAGDLGPTSLLSAIAALLRPAAKSASKFWHVL